MSDTTAGDARELDRCEERIEELVETDLPRAIRDLIDAHTAGGATEMAALRAERDDYARRDNAARVTWQPHADRALDPEMCSCLACRMATELGWRA